MSEIVFRGYLHKSPPEGFGSTLKPWRLRWCILADSRLAFPFATPYVRLEYYTNEQFANELDEPKGVIDLKDCNEVVDCRPTRGYDHVFDLCTDKRAYHFAAPSMEIKSIWMESLTAVLRNNTEGYGKQAKRQGLAKAHPNKRKTAAFTSELDISKVLVLSIINHVSHCHGLFFRRGVGNNAGDIQLESPNNSSPQHNSSENECVEIRYTQMDDRNSESASQPVNALANASYFDHNLQDDYQHLQHRKPDDVNPPPVKSGTSSNYDSFTRPFLQDDDDVDDYQHLDHKKNNQNGAYAATISTDSSLYGRLNRTEDDNYHHLNQHSTTIAASVDVKSSPYSSLCLDRDDYERMDYYTKGLHSKGDYQNTKYATIGGETSWYSQPRVPAIPARKQTYENTSHSLSTGRK